MAPCTELHIPYKEWAVVAELPAAHEFRNAMLAIERWARDQSCGGGSAAKSWCDDDTLTLNDDSNDTTTAISVSGTTADYLICTATIRVEETGIGGDLYLAGYWVADGAELNAHVAVEDWGWTWPMGAARVMSTTCIFPASSTVAFRMYNSSSSTTDAIARVHVTIVEALGHQSEACCSVGGG